MSNSLIQNACGNWLGVSINGSPIVMLQPYLSGHDQHTELMFFTVNNVQIYLLSPCRSKNYDFSRFLQHLQYLLKKVIYSRFPYHPKLAMLLFLASFICKKILKTVINHINFNSVYSKQIKILFRC